MVRRQTNAIAVRTENTDLKVKTEFPGDPVVRTLSSHC